MPRIRLVAGVLSAAAVLALAQGCSNDAADPGPSPATSSSTSSQPSGPASSPVPVSSSPAVEVSSSPRPTPSVVDPSSLTSANPWPADLTPEQVVDAQAALATYAGYQEIIDRAGAEPGADWNAEVSAVATAVAKSELLEALSQTATNGQRTSGTTQISPKVSSVAPALVVITDCVDSTKADFLNSSGVSIKAPDAPGSFYRHAASAQLVQLQDGSWRVAVAKDDWSTQC